MGNGRVSSGSRRHTTQPGAAPAPASKPKPKQKVASPAPRTPRPPRSRDGFDTTVRPDPLAVDRSAKGIQFALVAGDPKLVDKALRKGTDVPGRVQSGPTCGLYALGMVMDYYDRIDSKNLNPLVRTADTWRADSHNAPADTEKTLFDTAQKLGFTTQGEMFTSDQLGQLADAFGYQHKTHEDAGLKEIRASLDRGHPALVAFDVDFEGNPGLYKGMRAHWAVIEGSYKKDGVEYLVATHGWTGKEYVWRASDLEKSMRQLTTTDFAAAPKDIGKTINARVVEVWPK